MLLSYWTSVGPFESTRLPQTARGLTLKKSRGRLVPGSPCPPKLRGLGHCLLSLLLRKMRSWATLHKRWDTPLAYLTKCGNNSTIRYEFPELQRFSLGLI